MAVGLFAKLLANPEGLKVAGKVAKYAGIGVGVGAGVEDGVGAGDCAGDCAGNCARAGAGAGRGMSRPCRGRAGRAFWRRMRLKIWLGWSKITPPLQNCVVIICKIGRE